MIWWCDICGAKHDDDMPGMDVVQYLYDAASDFFDGTEEDRGHEPEWKAMKEALSRYDLSRSVSKK